jgi:iron complex transport system permease protein
MEMKHRKKIQMLVLLGILLILTALVALFFGGSKLSPSQVLSGLLGGEGVSGVILRAVRLPRVLAGVLAGVGLAVSGCLLQSVTDNGLASPNIIGVNAGAGAAVICLLFFFPRATAAMPFAAFLGALAATLLIVALARRIGMRRSSVILAGMALTAILNAVISFLSLLDSDVLATYSYFSVGGLSGVSLDRLWLPLAFICLALGLSVLFSRRLMVLSLGDGMALSLGVPVKRMRLLALVCASASAAAAVSFAGLLGFVGLIVPHLARRLVGEDLRFLLPASAMTGGILVVLADLVGRTLFAPTEVPVGIVMALIGAPFFLILLLGGKKHA